MFAVPRLIECAKMYSQGDKELAISYIKENGGAYTEEALAYFEKLNEAYTADSIENLMYNIETHFEDSPFVNHQDYYYTNAIDIDHSKTDHSEEISKAVEDSRSRYKKNKDKAAKNRTKDTTSVVPHALETVTGLESSVISYCSACNKISINGSCDC